MNCESDYCGTHGCTQSNNCPVRTSNGGARIETDNDLHEEIACTAVMLVAVLTPLLLVAIGVALGWLL